MINRKFIVENNDDGSLTLLDESNLSSNPICRIDKKEIFFGKGVTKISEIKNLIVDSDDSGDTFKVFVKENVKWNENVKKRHPIRWRLGLISKSKPLIITIGTASSSKDSEKLKSFFDGLLENSEK